MLLPDVTALHVSESMLAIIDLDDPASIIVDRRLVGRSTDRSIDRQM